MDARALVLFLAVGCGGAAADGVTPVGTDTTAGKVTAKAGSPQTAVVQGGPIAAQVASVAAVAVKIVDSIGVPVPDAIINFVVTAGGGSVFAPAVASSVAGIANEQWTLGTKAGAQTVEARWINPETGEGRVLGTVQGTAQAGAIASLRFASDVSISAVVGTAMTVASTRDMLGPLLAGDKYSNALPTADAVFGVTGTAATPGPSLNTQAPGKSRIVASLGGLTAAEDLILVDDLRGVSLRFSYSCAQSTQGNIEDSVQVQATGVVNSYLTTSPATVASQIALLPLSGSTTSWHSGSPQNVSATTDTLRLGQRTDTLSISSNGGGLARNGVYFADLTRVASKPLVFSGGGWCGASWKVSSPIRVESVQ